VYKLNQGDDYDGLPQDNAQDKVCQVVGKGCGTMVQEKEE
jgi:hypothetical protein